MTQRRKWFFVVLTAMLSTTVDAASPSTGTLEVIVRASDSTPVRGAKVTLWGIVVPRMARTNDRGASRFAALSPGTYAVTVEQPGSRPAEPVNVVVSAGRDTAIHVTLWRHATTALGGGGTSPLLDTSRVSLGMTTSQADIETVPTARDPWNILQRTPGVLTDRINAGGNGAGQQMAHVGPGALGTEAVWSVDGVNITDMASLGGSPAYFNFDHFKDVRVSTGGSGAAVQTSGLQINVTTKQGTNEWRVGGRYYSPGLRGNASYEGQPTITELPRRNRHVDVHDYGAEIGGPIIKDRLWIWGAYGDQRMDVLTQPIDGPVPRTGNYTSTLANLDWQRDNKRMSARMNLGDWGLPDVGAYARPDASTYNQDGRLNVFKFDKTHMFGDDLHLNGMYARVNSGFNNVPHVTDRPAFFIDNQPFGSYFQFETSRSSNQFRGDGGYSLSGLSGKAKGLKSALRFGAGYRDFTSRSRVGWPQGQLTFVDDPFNIVLFPGIFLPNTRTNYLDAYLENTMSTSRLTANVGLRFDRQWGRNLASQVLPNPEEPTLVPGGEFADQESPFSWTNVSPRIGLTYAMDSAQKRLFTFSYGRFPDQLGIDHLQWTHPLAEVPQDGSAGALYDDRNGNRRFDRGVDNIGMRAIVGIPTDDPNFFVPLSRYAEGLRAPVVKEYTLGAAFELGTNRALRLTYVNRQYLHTLDQIGLIRDQFGATRPRGPADFLSGPNLTGVDYAGRPFDQPTYRLAQGLSTVDGVEIINSERTARYQGMLLQLDKRFADRCMLGGNLALGRWRWSVPESARFDPNNYLRYGDVDGELVAPQSILDAKDGIFLNSNWSFNLWGQYRVAPARPWGFNLAGNVTGRQGYPGPAYATADELLVGDPDRRHDNVFYVDGSVSKRFTFNRFGMSVGLDGFNLFNSNAPLQIDRDATSSTPGQITEIISPRRLVRLGLRLSF